MLDSNEIAFDARSGRPIAPERAIVTNLWTAFVVFFAAVSGHLANEFWQKDRIELAILSATSVVISLLLTFKRQKQAQRLRRSYQLKLNSYEAGLEQMPF